MWLKNGTGVAIRRCPDPSRASVSSMAVSLVLRLMVARRVMGAKSYLGARRAQISPPIRMEAKPAGRPAEAAESARDLQEFTTPSDIMKGPLVEARSQPGPRVQPQPP